MTARSTDTTTGGSRRMLLAGALGGLGAWVASAVGRASPVRAEGEAIVVGGEYTTAASATRLQNSANSSAVFIAQSTGGGNGLWGTSGSAYGVLGQSTSSVGVAGGSTSSIGVIGTSISNIGVYGMSDAVDQPAIFALSQGNSTAVQGYSGTGTPTAAQPRTGVFGEANQDASSRGVWGASTAGVGLYGSSTSGYALRTSGRVRADRVSGVARIGAGRTSVTVSPGVDVTSSSFVLLTPKANLGGRGLWFTTSATGNTFTIRISSSRSSATRVAWLLLG